MFHIIGTEEKEKEFFKEFFFTNNA